MQAEALFEFDMPRSLDGWVYVIGPTASSVVKIGTARNVKHRLSALQTSHPEKLEVLWTTRGGRGLERRLHGDLKAFRIIGEWFDFGENDPVQTVSECVAGYGLALAEATQASPGEAVAVPPARASSGHIAAELRAWILSGPPNVKSVIPSTSQLMEGFGASNPTAQRVVEILREEGLVRSERGRGVFVIHAPGRERPVGISAKGVKSRALDAHAKVPPADVAAALAIDNPAGLRVQHSVDSEAGSPVELLWRYALVPDLGSDATTDACTTVARLPTRYESAVLEIPSSVPVLRTMRRCMDGAGRCVAVTIHVRPGHLGLSHDGA